MKKNSYVLMHSDYVDQHSGEVSQALLFNRPFDPRIMCSAEIAHLWTPAGTKMERLPEMLAAMSGLKDLTIRDQVENAALASMKQGDLPESLERLVISNSLKTLNWPNVVLPNLKELVALPTIKFSASCFPSLERIYLNPNKNLSNLVEALKLPLKALHLLGFPNGGGIFEAIAGADLDEVGLLGARSLIDLDGIGKISSIRSIKLKNLPGLVDIGGLKDLTKLRSVNIQYCNKVRNLEILNDIPGIEKLIIIGALSDDAVKLEPRLQKVMDESIGPAKPA